MEIVMEVEDGGERGWYNKKNCNMTKAGETICQTSEWSFIFNIVIYFFIKKLGGRNDLS